MAASTLLTTPAAARRVGITTAYARLLALTGKIPYQRIGPLYCFTAEDLDAWDKARREKVERRMARRAAEGGPQA